MRDRTVAELQRRYPGLVLCPTERAEHATELAKTALANDADVILVAGGDGTVNEVLNGMVGSTAPLGVLPSGTANVFACEVGLPRDPLASARMLPDLIPRRIAVGRLTTADRGSRHFLLMAGAGLDAAVLTRVDARIKKRTGKFAYYVAGFSMLGQPMAPLEATVDGQRLETLFALAARVRNYGGDLAIASGASLLADEFELVAFAGRTTWRYPMYLGGALLGRATSLPGVSAVKARRIELRGLNGKPVYAQIDGEPAGRLPATIELIPDAITLLLPQRYLERESK